MPLNLASPGLVVREVDLTIGRVNTSTTKSAGIVAPYPHPLPLLVCTEPKGVSL